MDALSTLRTMGWVDLTLLAILCASVLVGLWRGFAFEVVSLLGWLVAFVIANACGPFIANLLPGSTDGFPMRLWVTYAVVFVLVLVACTALARMLRALISATPLSVLDRLLGGVFGLLRAALLMVIIATLVALSPFAKSPAWQDSHGQVWLGQALELLKPVLPERLNVRISA